MGSNSTNPSLLYLGRFFFQVSVLRLGIYFTVHLNFLLLLTTFEHKRLYFLLLTFSKQTRHFSFNAFEGKYRLCLFCVIASSLPNVHITHGRRSKTKWCEGRSKMETDREGDQNGEKRWLISAEIWQSTFNLPTQNIANKTAAFTNSSDKSSWFYLWD